MWLIVLSDQSEQALFGKTSTARYLNSTLVPQGTLLSNYYATSHGALADGIALLSGQGPTPEQQLGCPTYANVTPGTVDSGGAGQVHGHGCVLPPAVYSLPDQLDRQRTDVEGVHRRPVQPRRPERAPGHLSPSGGWLRRPDGRARPPPPTAT